MNRLHRSALLVITVLALLDVACSGESIRMPLSAAPNAQSPIDARSVRLFVANFPLSTVTIYPAGRRDPSPIDTLTNGIVAPRSLWVDSGGTLYVANDFGQNNPYSDTVTVFAPGAHSPERVLSGLIFPGAIAVDSRGTVYVQDLSAIQVYEGNATAPTRTITGLGNGASAFAVDDRDSVYALIAVITEQRCRSFVVRIPRGATGGSRIGVSEDGCGDGIALDSHENLYVGYYGNDNISEIDVFRPHSRTPFRTITEGLNAPMQMKFGPGGSLFVPNDNTSNVKVYLAGGDVPVNTISKGIMNPFSVAVSPPAPY